MEKRRAAERQAQAGPSEGKGKKTGSAKFGVSAHGDTAPGKSKNTAAKFGRSDSGYTRSILASRAAVSPRTFDKAARIFKTARRCELVKG